MTRERIAEIIKENVTFSQQVDGYVIHGAIDKILQEHYKAINRLDDQFNALVACCSVLSKAGCKHDLHVINEWVNKYTMDDGYIDWRKILSDKGIYNLPKYIPKK
jgi:hypothetical protein